MKFQAKYVVFDCLVYENKSIINEPIEKRLEFLKKAVTENNVLQIIYTSHNGLDLWDKILVLGVEGVIAKRKGSVYLPGKRSDLWLKIKNSNIIDCVILGYTKGKGKRASTFGALIIGAYKDGELIRLGKVGTGWSERFAYELKRRMDKLKIDERGDEIILKPKIVCEIEYMEITKNYSLREPVFKRLRFDKNPEDCIIE